MKQWERANVKFKHPVVIQEQALCKKITSCWTKANKVAKEKCSLAEKKYMVDHLDKLLNITNCCHTIFKCEDQDSGSSNAKKCEKEVHINVLILRKYLLWSFSGCMDKDQRLEKSPTCRWV